MEKHLIKLSGNGPHPRPGNVSTVTVEDMHLAVAKITDKHVGALLLARYGGDDGQRTVIITKLKTMFLSHRKWKMSQCELLVSNALDEYLNPRYCKACNGFGHTMQTVRSKGAIQVECEVCSGKGILPFSKRERARRMKVSAPTWNNYQSIYQLVLDTLTDWNFNGVKFVRARIS